MLDKTLGVAFVMNCHDARESLSMLLDGDIGLTERVPLELHVNTCGECRQRLADLRTIKVVEEKPAPRPVHHWRPILAAGFVGKALHAIRTDDAGSRLRRFVGEKFPPRHLSLAAAVPLLVMLAIFVFERGFTAGTAMRQRSASAPAVMRDSPPAPTPPPAVSPEPVIPTERPPLPSAPSPSPAPAARAPAPPSHVTPPAAPPKPAPAKAAPASAPPAPAPSPRRERVAAVRAVPSKVGSPTSDSAVSVPASRRGTVDVIGRLQVKSRSEAERDLAALLSRAGGTSVSRQRGPTVTVVEASVPHANFGKFTQGVVRIGSWRVEAERTPLPDLVQVSVRLAD